MVPPAADHDPSLLRVQLDDNPLATYAPRETGKKSLSDSAILKNGAAENHLIGSAAQKANSARLEANPSTDANTKAEAALRLPAERAYKTIVAACAERG